ncbi:MAG: alpha/beta fold hydrolase [Candidatus Wallbacteria bacterium]|nr:alpha/beta fold hydrolase [Candidatus Wallbacteria bacterium]
MLPQQQPFRLPGGDAGILLIHGFTGSPADMRPLGEFLNARGMTVLAPLLPGHASEPAELNKVTWQEWYQTVRDSLEELRKDCGRVFASGLSMGGALALHLAAHHPLDGVATLATGLRPKDWRVPFVGFVKHVMPFDPKRGGEDIKDPNAKGSFTGYDVWPTWGVHELVRLNRHVREDLPEVDCPLLVIHAKDDHTVPVEDAQILIEESASKSKKKLVLENSYHVITLDFERERVENEVWSFISSVLEGADGYFAAP